MADVDVEAKFTSSTVFFFDILSNYVVFFCIWDLSV